MQLTEDGGLDWHALKSGLRPHTKCALIQRSCGYSWRQSLSVDEIGKAIEMIKVIEISHYIRSEGLKFGALFFGLLIFIQ